MNVRTSMTVLVSLCALIAGLLLAVPAALAVTPPVVEETSVLDVAGTSATFNATINPEESETTYRFEYGTSEAYGSSVPVPDGIVGSGSIGVTVSAHPQELLPSTTYHYRVVALVASRGEAVPGADGTFTTQPAGSEFVLPDGRQWELVTPPNKHGASIQSLGQLGPIQAAEDGSAITYGTSVPIEPEPAGYGPGLYFEQARSARGAQGWSTRDIATPHNSQTGHNAPSEYQLFSSDLSLGLAFPTGEDNTLLSVQASEPTPYIRRESLCDAPASASECYLPILTDKEGFADVPPGTSLGGVTFEGASPNLNHVVTQSSGLLAEWSANEPPSEALQSISVLPASEGGTTTQGVVGGTENSNWPGNRHSISNDGSHVFWLRKVEGGTALYMRDLLKRETVRLDVPQPGVPSNGHPPYAKFQIASSDGSKVFFTDFDEEQRLTPQSGSTGRDLYECEIAEKAGKLTCELTDLTPETEGQSAGVQRSVLGASEDGSYVYFAARGVLGDGAQHGAVPGSCGESSGTCNLYEYHEGRVMFIAALSNEDEIDWDAGWNPNMSDLMTRVSPDGRYLAFMSSKSLTGYDNRDAVSGKPDMEVYLYDALTERLVCASCNPTGSRPSGVEVGEFAGPGPAGAPRPNIVDVQNGGDQVFSLKGWVAANLPSSDWLGGYGESLYQSRALSNSGRLFFNSSDALVPQDVNGQEDVYEFEPEGVGSCAASSMTFNSRTGGCVSLISAGTSPEESGFMDASATGGDVFFLTSGRLTSQDYDTSYDIYDAHECAAGAPCVAQPVSPPPCSSGDSCKAAPLPQPAIYGAPASATFTGAGNVFGGLSTPVVTSKSLTQAQRLAQALKACGKKPRRKRAGCERLARKRYLAIGTRTVGGATRKTRG